MVKLLVFAIGIIAISANADVQKPRQITLTLSNSVVLRERISARNMFLISLRLQYLDATLPKGESIYLALDTPGGEINAEEVMVQVVRGLSRPVTTITVRSASAGFFLVQSLGRRFILDNGTMMAHAPYLYIEGRVRDTLETNLKSELNDVKRIERRTAKRLGISLQSYYRLIAHEYHTLGSSAVDQHAADEVVVVTCEPQLINSTFNYFVQDDDTGESYIHTYSACPLHREVIESTKINKE